MGLPSVVYEALRELSDYYVGKDPTRMEHHFQVLSRETHFMGSVLRGAERRGHRHVGYPGEIAEQAGVRPASAAR